MWWEGIRKTFFPTEDEIYSERRQTVRRAKHFGVTWDADPQPARAVVVDISEGGMRLETRNKVARGEHLAIQVLVGTQPARGAPVECEVCWVREQQRSGRVVLGVRFVDRAETLGRAWVQRQLEEGARSPRQRRRHRRLPCQIGTEVWSEFGEKIIDGVVTNLAVGGASLELAEKAPKGMVLELRIGPFENLGVLQVMSRVAGVREEIREGRRGMVRRYVHGTVFTDVTSAQRRHLAKFLKTLAEQAGRT